jgi:hypothetical protein
MRWSIPFALCAMVTVASAHSLRPQDGVVVVDEHHAIQREIALGRLAQHGSDRIAELGRHLVRDMGYADDQVQAFARMRHADLISPPDLWDHALDERLAAIAQLDGAAFDRAILAALDDQLGHDLAWIDSLGNAGRDGDLVTLLATMRPTLARYQGQAAWLARRFRPAT